MPVPPVDMVSHQQAKNVRVKLFRRINPMSRFVDPEALLVLETAMDAGNDLALVLDDKCWALLMLVEHGAAAHVLRQALKVSEKVCEKAAAAATTAVAATTAAAATVCGFVAGTCMRLIQDAMAYRAHTYASVYAMHMAAAVPVWQQPPAWQQIVVGTPAGPPAGTGPPASPPAPDDVASSPVKRVRDATTSDAGTRFPRRSISR